MHSFRPCHHRSTHASPSGGSTPPGDRRRGVARLLLPLAGLALLLALGAGGAGGCDSARIESLRELSQGMRQYHKKAFPKAREHFQTAVDTDPSNDQAHFYLGMVLFHQLHEVPAAETHLRKALELRPEEPEYAYQLAIVLLARGSADSEAETLLRKAIAQQPAHAEAHYRLAALLEKRGQLDEAVRMYMRSIELKPRFVRPYLALAALYEEYDLLAPAVQVLENAAYNCPKEHEAHGELGRLLAMKKQYSRAIEQYLEALKLKADYEGAIFNLGVAYLENQQRDAAIRQLRHYLARVRRGIDPFRWDMAEMTVARLEQEAADAAARAEPARPAETNR